MIVFPAPQLSALYCPLWRPEIWQFCPHTIFPLASPPFLLPLRVAARGGGFSWLSAWRLP
nr:MAG TPA: hypothetical protein [Caudoviricetes sp.]